MREYRVQTKYGDNDWRFCTDGRGKYYTYDSEATARRFGVTHAPRRFDPVTNKWVRVFDNFRIVYSDIAWVPLDM